MKSIPKSPKRKKPAVLNNVIPFPVPDPYSVENFLDDEGVLDLRAWLCHGHNETGVEISWDPELQAGTVLTKRGKPLWTIRRVA